MTSAREAPSNREIIDAAPWNLPLPDLNASIQRTQADFVRWSDARILITGGTGFLGRWIVATVALADIHLGLNMRIDVLTRGDHAKELGRSPHVECIQGDVRDFCSQRSYDLIIHGAASSSAPIGVGDGSPGTMSSTIVDGTRRVIDVARSSRARLVFLSSGAVYGPLTQPVPESHRGGPDPLEPASAYGEAKRLAENLCAIATSEGVVDAVIARLFAFVGPGIPLQAHYAAGNFLRDVLLGQPIIVQGDGRPIRSYLYCGDLSDWVWGLVSRGQSGRAYNVGSPDGIRIRDLAVRVASLTQPTAAVQVLAAEGEGPPPCYVPVTDLAERELGLAPRTSLDLALEKTLEWLRGSAAVDRGR